MALYARGLSMKEIQGYLHEIYGTEVGSAFSGLTVINWLSVRRPSSSRLSAAGAAVSSRPTGLGPAPVDASASFDIRACYLARPQQCWPWSLSQLQHPAWPGADAAVVVVIEQSRGSGVPLCYGFGSRYRLCLDSNECAMTSGGRSQARTAALLLVRQAL